MYKTYPLPLSYYQKKRLHKAIMSDTMIKMKLTYNQLRNHDVEGSIPLMLTNQQIKKIHGSVFSLSLSGFLSQRGSSSSIKC